MFQAATTKDMLSILLWFQEDRNHFGDQCPYDSDHTTNLFAQPPPLNVRDVDTHQITPRIEVA